MELPQATQTVDSRGKILKSARCPMPSHKDSIGRGAKTSRFLAAQQDFEGNKFWTFSCHFGGKPYHAFQALPDPSAPENEADLPAWIERQKEANKKTKTLQ